MRFHPDTNHRRCAGFSAVEVLVVIAILGILFSLTTTAVQRIRTSATRTRCLNNLRQVGIAHQAYHTACGRLPPGVSSENEKAPQPFMSWHTRLLPYLEQSPLWEQTLTAYEQNRDFLKSPPHVGLGTPIAAFSCPADSRTQTAHTLRNGTVVALTSYLGVEGTRAFHRDGVLFLDSKIRLTDIADGTSQTLIVGERPPSADLILGWWYAGWGQDKDGEGDMLLGVRTKNNQSWAPSCPVGPYNFQPGKFDNPCGAFHFWSPHTGGAYFAFTDGSVRLLRYSADDVLPALATRAGGESVAVPE